jgi:ParB family chromosome partitioning protein
MSAFEISSVEGVSAVADEARVSPVSTGRDVAVSYNLLTIGAGNVRKKRNALSLPELAALIKAQGLLQRLTIIDAGGGRFDVVAGGRRLQALGLLVAAGDLAADAAIECKLYESKRAAELSLAENSGREEMHPADEFEAFARLIDADGLTIEQVAGRFGVSRLTVERRMALGKLAPRFLDLYREDGIDTEQLQALSLTSDHERQSAAWDSLQPYARSAYMLRQQLTDEEMEIDHRFVRFVGVEAYTAAGGAIRSDLFSDEGEAWVQDTALLLKLKTEKLEAALQPFRDAAWSWVEAHDDLNQSCFFECDRERPKVKIDATEEAGMQAFKVLVEEATQQIAELQRRYEASETDEEGVVIDAQLTEASAHAGELRDMFTALHEAATSWTAKQLDSCGVIVSITHQGVLDVRAGLRRPQDKKAMVAELKKAGKPIPASLAGVVKERAAFSERLMLDMTAHRTAALQAALTSNAHVALALVVHKMAEPIFATGYSRMHSPLKLQSSVTGPGTLSDRAPQYADSLAAVTLDQAKEMWSNRLPGGDGMASTLSWFVEQDKDTLLELLAFCTASAIDAMHGRESSTYGEADALLDALDVDMADWWAASGDKYLSNVSKAQMIEAVTQACGAEVAKPLAGMKKADAVGYAQSKLEGTRWLPAPLQRKAVSAA